MPNFRDIGRTSTGNNHFYKSHFAGGRGGPAGGQPPGRPNRGELYLDFNDRSGGNGGGGGASGPGGAGGVSPPSDSGGIFDSHCFATTPSSSNGNRLESNKYSIYRDVCRTPSTVTNIDVFLNSTCFSKMNHGHYFLFSVISRAMRARVAARLPPPPPSS